MEKADNVYVMLGEFGWSDLGTWGSLYDLSPKDESGNVVIDGETVIYNSNNNIISLPKGKLAVIDGLDGYIVTQDGDILMICKKDEEQTIRKFVNDVKVKYNDQFD